MKDQYQWLRDFVLKRTKVWEKRLGITDFEIEHVFLDSYFGDDGEEDFKITAVTESRPQYMEAKIKWYLPSAIRHDRHKIEETLVHELTHVLLSPEQSILAEIRSSDMDAGEKVADLYSYQVENATERVARAFWKAYPA